MLTPVFVCKQDETFVIISITLSALCKVTAASFDVLDYQFTFHCSPYYLRLKFDQRITEGCGERATFDVETNVLTVYIPKERRGEIFAQLENPAYLLGTDQQRRRLVQLVSGEENSSGENENTLGTSNADENEEDEETEFCQRLPVPSELESAGGDYGFAGGFSGLFAALDADIVAEVLDLPCNPDRTTPAQRRQLRVEAENAAFDEDALLDAFEDADGEVRRLLANGRLVRPVVACNTDNNEAAHEKNKPNETPADVEEEEEEAVLLPSAGVVPIWNGNVAEFGQPPLDGAAQVSQQRTDVLLTSEDRHILQRLAAPRLLFPPRSAVVYGLTLDILFAEAFDDLLTEGTGCSESLWNVCKMSSALSWLDPAENVYDACVFFARRALIYPLHRHFELVQRAMGFAGTRLLRGKSHVLQALLRVRALLSHAEHRHVLVALFLDPLLAYWTTAPDADTRLRQIAHELHHHVTRVEPEMEKDTESAEKSLLILRERRQLQPLTLLTLGLPLTP